MNNHKINNRYFLYFVSKFEILVYEDKISQFLNIEFKLIRLSISFNFILNNYSSPLFILLIKLFLLLFIIK